MHEDAESSRTHHQVTFLVLASAVMAYALLSSLVTPVLATLQHDLHTSQANVTWVLTAYLLSASVFTPIIGRIGDKVGKERMLVAALGALALGSMIAALAPDLDVMIVARVVQGVGGGVLPLSFGIIRDEFPRERISGAVGTIASLAAVGGGLGIFLAGPIVDALNYHWLFWIPMILTLATAVATHLVVPESPVRTDGRISLAPAVLLSGWLVALLVALSEGPTWGWGSGKVVGLLLLAAALAVSWVQVERRSAAPLIDMRMMRLPAVWTTNLVALLVGVGLYATFAFLPQFAQTPTSSGYGFGASITRSGVLLLPSSVTMFVTGQQTARLAKAFGAKSVIVAGAAISAAALAMMAFAHSHEWELLVATAVMGVGVGLAFAALSFVVVAAVPASQTGVASGMNANIRTIGGSVGAALMASIVTSALLPSGLPKESGYTYGFAALAGALLLAALAGLLIPAITQHAEDAAGEVAPGRPAGLVGAGSLAAGAAE
jgi:EmrB/QacA subfamily drug resistance transporter